MDERRIILIIDDNPLMIASLTNILSPQYNVKAACDGAAGLVYAKKYSVDLILMRVIMKKMSGYEVLAQLKDDKDTQDIPVIFITSREVGDEEIKALQSGAVDYIRQPIVPEIVALRVGIIMKMIAQMKTIERFSLIDGLTGVNNRRSFDRQLETEWNRAARSGMPLSMLMLDIDHFKAFNDKYGHLNGDTALKTVANVLVDSLQRGTDFVFRWGGEEFAVLLPETPLKGALVVAERMRKNISSTPVSVGNKNVNITISIGAATTIPDTSNSDVSDFCETIDKALYKSKNNGRNRVEIAD
ncbi:MAG: diguanylate cyclase [Clostridiales bacterium]|jgi:diguanylate cyclase (GGDEF)-like protein|nr:diguanylate cyclase [Clostridiales bacterium]